MMDGSYDCSDFGRVGQMWISYEGAFKGDMKHGQGIIELTNGEKVVGTFREDRLDGPGAIYRQDGSIQEAQWKENHLICPPS